MMKMPPRRQSRGGDFSGHPGGETGLIAAIGIAAFPARPLQYNAPP